MKLQKAIAVIGMSACLLGTQVLGAAAQDPAMEAAPAAEAAPAPTAEAAPAASTPAPAAEASTPAAPQDQVVTTPAPASTTTASAPTAAAPQAAAPATVETPASQQSETGTTETEEDAGQKDGQNIDSTEGGQDTDADKDKEDTEIDDSGDDSADSEKDDSEDDESEAGDSENDSEEDDSTEDGSEGDGSEVGDSEDDSDKDDSEDDGTNDEDDGQDDNNDDTQPGTDEEEQPDTPADTPSGTKPSGGSGGGSSQSGQSGQNGQNSHSSQNTPAASTLTSQWKQPQQSLGSFQASDTFLDNRDKIKYNVDLPLDGIPSFITQEMIVGALKCQDETGYPASVTIAQIIQESGYGKYGPGGESGKGLSYLAYQYNNLFGIKGTGPAGSVNMQTGEQAADGSSYFIRSGFRVYNTYTECIEDRAKLLEEVYSDLTEGVTDANTFAVRIGGRWATDIDYGLTLIQVMERYDLYRLDELTLNDFSEMLGTFVNPCPGATLTSRFGYRSAPTAGASSYHKGIDLGTGTYNIPTYAAAEGTVTFAGEAKAEGIMIVIDHGNGLVSKYMHHDKIYVKEGDEVEKGQQIGLSGTTGVSTGNHLHFQVEENGQAVDPLPYLTEAENQ